MTDFYHAYIRLFPSVVYGDLGNPFYPILNCVRYVWNDLYIMLLGVIRT